MGRLRERTLDSYRIQRWFIQVELSMSDAVAVIKRLDLVAFAKVLW
jgi:hypothetical protein